VRLAFACPYLNATPKVTIAQTAAVMHAGWTHPWVANICTERTPHIQACERILKRALQNANLDALFWTEDDCVLPQDAVTRLVALLEAHPEVDIATGITFMRYSPYHPMIAEYAGVLTQEELDRHDRSMIVNARRGEPVVGKEHYRFITRIDTSAKPYRIDATSMNCLLFRRRALEVMGSIEHPFDTGHFTTPDFALFHRLRGRCTTFVDPALLTLHLGPAREIGFETWVEEMEAWQKRGDAVRLPDEEPVGEP
jgi:hypothetical protein